MYFLKTLSCSLILLWISVFFHIISFYSISLYSRFQSYDYFLELFYYGLVKIGKVIFAYFFIYQ